MDWTTSQLEAIETRGRRVLVSAGAGSGKTRVLVERFIRLLEENASWRVQDIVAVTFTEKAAREMVSRIRREIRSRIETAPSAEARRRWRERRNALDSARVGTIHSLCSSILRAHTAEAALDPTFEVIEEVEAAALLEQAINQAIDEAAGMTAHTYLTSEIEILAFLSIYDVQTALRLLIAQGEKARRAMAQLPDSGDRILAHWQRRLKEIKSQVARSIINREDWKRACQTIHRLAGRDAADKREQVRAQVAALLTQLQSGMDESGDGGDEALTRRLLEIEACINLRGGSKRNWASEGDFNALKEALSRVRDVVGGEKLLSLETNEADRVAAEVTARLARLYERARHRYSALKREQNALDFNDLEEITERMLERYPEVRARYTDADRGLVRALMVDEFQDTSPIQKRVLWMIAPQADELFIIGDSKQSIYRFRGADVTVFHEARAEFAIAGREIGMDVCFRTHERLISFVNHIFPEVFTAESHYDTPYEKMSAGRAAHHARAAVELHIIAQEKEAGARLSADELRAIEARVAARRIKEIVGQGEITVCDKNDSARGTEYGDFALLFQASTSFEIYEQALAEAEVPYVTIAGRGFYDRQEITDITNLMAFLASPIDSLRLAAVLRSPMFALSDETLFRLRLKRGTLWKSLFDETITHDEGERDAVEFARAALLRLNALAGRVSAAEIIIAALGETGYLATLMALPHGERRCANVEKLIEQAHLLAPITLSEMVERAADLRLREAREGEATVEEAGAVRLMTVHKSKGLEFPIVWIADASYRGAGDRSVVAAHPDVGVSVNITADHLEIDETLRAASFEMLRRIEERMDRAEKKRLLYVAATRARDHLVISGSARGKATGDHWLGRIMNALDLCEEGHPERADYEGGSVTIQWHTA